MSTPFSQKNFDFSKAAHMVARETIYPEIFGLERERLGYKDVTSDILDFDFGIDRLVGIKDDYNYGRWYKLTVQERFRRISESGYTDITITSYNRNTGKSSELYKLNANLFLYGFYDDINKCIPKYTCFHCSTVDIAVIKHKIPYKPGYNPRSNQDFITIEHDDLVNGGHVLQSRW